MELETIEMQNNLQRKLEDMDTELARKDAKVAELRKLNEKWYFKHKDEKRKVERYKEKAKEVNQSEIDQLEKEITRLRAEINQLKRDRRDARKYKKIYEIVTGEVME
jgi:uncharacterized protein involved in exopolysaccharide biosynthesis